MSLDENKALVRNFIKQVWNERNLAAVDQYFAQTVMVGNDQVGVEAIKQEIQAWLHAFPDIHVAIESLLADADQVVGSVTISGTHRNMLPLGVQTIPPTGKQIKVRNIGIVRVRDGKIVADTEVLDSLELARQLGLTLQPQTQDDVSQA